MQQADKQSNQYADLLQESHAPLINLLKPMFLFTSKIFSTTGLEDCDWLRE